MFFLNLNLYNPGNLTLAGALLTALILGVIHGITPDEHTWPITFSYAVGSYSTKGGMKAGFIFSSGFTIQRALLAEAAWFALVGILQVPIVTGIIYAIVGLAMLIAGAYIKERSIYPHWHLIAERLGVIVGIHKEHSRYAEKEFSHAANPIQSKDTSAGLRAVPSKLAFLHGLIAGFGFGAFALILVTVIVPAMPGPLYAWIPGALFGIGTMLTQVLMGAFFGRWLTRVKRLTRQGIAFVSRSISADVLFYGGMLFMMAGLAIVIYPGIQNYGINTGIKVHNLDVLNIGFFLVVIAVVVVSAFAYGRALRRAKELGFMSKAPPKNESQANRKH
jgi:hypothetical protein